MLRFVQFLLENILEKDKVGLYQDHRLILVQSIIKQQSH